MLHTHRPRAIPIIVCAYRKPQALAACLSALVEHTTRSVNFYLITNSPYNGPIPPQFTVFRPTTNLGKSRAFHRHWHQMRGEHNLLVSVDGDIVVENGWLDRLIDEYEFVRQHLPFAGLAPSYRNRDIHGPPSKQLSSTLYAAQSVGGGLLLLNATFFNQIDKYGWHESQRPYRGDDAYVCRAAHQARRFIGYTTSTYITELNDEESPEYRAWKADQLRQERDAAINRTSEIAK